MYEEDIQGLAGGFVSSRHASANGRKCAHSPFQIKMLRDDASQRAFGVPEDLWAGGGRGPWRMHWEVLPPK